MKHKDILQAWLDGKDIEYFSSSDVWKPMHKPNEVSSAPGFFDHIQYRIKPVTHFVFFHTIYITADYKGSIFTTDTTYFSYPSFKPSDAHIMIELNSDHKVIATSFSPTSTVNKTFTKEI